MRSENSCYTLVIENYLIISDLQIPFHEPKALEFCLYLVKHYKINKEHVICVGDEVDQYFGSKYPLSPDAPLSPIEELKSSIEELKRWYDAFPVMRLCISNHGIRWMKKASESGIPSRLLRSCKEG